jgi:sugar O-acyltransferase (sialic acid O-acetyltransferase NeuD family)
MPDVVLVGASGLAREVAAAAASGWNIVGMLDDDPALHGTRVGGTEVLGGVDRASGTSASLLVCIGSGRSRRAVVERLARLGVGGERYATFVDDSVRIAPGVEVGAGSIVLRGSVLTADLRIGSHVVLMPNVVLTHDDVVEDYVTLAAGVAVGGFAVLRAESYLGMNSSVRERTTVGARAVVGMGAAVVTDIPDGETWVGVPARPLLARASPAPELPELSAHGKAE